MTQKRNTFRFIKHYSDPLLNLSMATVYLVACIFPDALDVEYLSLLIMFEFILVHSDVTMAASPRNFSIYILAPCYGLFAIVFTVAAGDLSIAWLYLLVVFNRLRYSVGIADSESWFGLLMIAFARIVIYMVAVIIGVLLEDSVDIGPLIIAGIPYFTALAAFDFWIACSQHNNESSAPET